MVPLKKIQQNEWCLPSQYGHYLPKGVTFFYSNYFIALLVQLEIFSRRNFQQCEEILVKNTEIFKKALKILVTFKCRC